MPRPEQRSQTDRGSDESGTVRAAQSRPGPRRREEQCTSAHARPMPKRRHEQVTHHAPPAEVGAAPHGQRRRTAGQCSATPVRRHAQDVHRHSAAVRRVAGGPRRFGVRSAWWRAAACHRMARRTRRVVRCGVARPGRVMGRGSATARPTQPSAQPVQPRAITTFRSGCGCGPSQSRHHPDAVLRPGAARPRPRQPRLSRAPIGTRPSHLHRPGPAPSPARPTAAPRRSDPATSVACPPARSHRATSPASARAHRPAHRPTGRAAIRP